MRTRLHPQLVFFQKSDARHHHQREEQVERQVPGAAEQQRVKRMHHKSNQAARQGCQPGVAVPRQGVAGMHAQEPIQAGHQHQEKQVVADRITPEQFLNDDLQPAADACQALHPVDMFPQGHPQLPGNDDHAVGQGEEERYAAPEDALTQHQAQHGPQHHHAHRQAKVFGPTGGHQAGCRAGQRRQQQQRRQPIPPAQILNFYSSVCHIEIKCTSYCLRPRWAAGSPYNTILTSLPGTRITLRGGWPCRSF